MRQSMDSLTNLAFLYILAGGMLPMDGGLFDSVAQNLQNLTGESIDNLTGTGLEEMAFDTEVFPDNAYGMDASAMDGDQLGGFDGQDLADDNDALCTDDNIYNPGDDLAFPEEFQSYGEAGFGNGTDFDGGDRGLNFGAGDGGVDCGDGGGDVDCGDCGVGDILGNILEEL
jgi:hypothetical protein